MTTPESVDEMLALITTATNRLGEDVGAALDEDTTPDIAVILLYRIREARKALAELEASVEGTAAGRMPSSKPLQVGTLIAERKGGAIRKQWEHDRVAWDVIRARLATENDGQVPSDAEMATAVLVRDALLNCAQISGWRTTQLRPLGLDPDRYATVERGRRTVHVTAAIPDDLPAA